LQEPGCVLRIESSGVGIELEHLFLKEGLAISRWLCSGEFGVGRLRLQASAKLDSKTIALEGVGVSANRTAKGLSADQFQFDLGRHHRALSLR